MTKLILLFMTMTAGSAWAAPKLDCVAGKELTGHVFQSLTLTPDAKVLTTDVLNKAGQRVDLPIAAVKRGDGKIEISGAPDLNKGIACAGSCGKDSFVLTLGGMPETQDNAILTLTHEGFSEVLGLSYVTVSSASYVCKTQELESLSR